MEEILHHLMTWYVVYPIIFEVFYIPGGAGFLPSTVVLIININIINIFWFIPSRKPTYPTFKKENDRLKSAVYGREYVSSLEGNTYTLGHQNHENEGFKPSKYGL